MRFVNGLINLIPGVVNTFGNLVKDKKKMTKETEHLLPPLLEDKDNVASGLMLSSKAVVGYGLAGIVVMAGLSTGDWKVLAIGATILIVTTLAKAFGKSDA